MVLLHFNFNKTKFTEDQHLNNNIFLCGERICQTIWLQKNHRYRTQPTLCPSLSEDML